MKAITSKSPDIQSSVNRKMVRNVELVFEENVWPSNGIMVDPSEIESMISSYVHA